MRSLTLKWYKSMQLQLPKTCFETRQQLIKYTRVKVHKTSPVTETPRGAYGFVILLTGCQVTFQEKNYMPPLYKKKVWNIYFYIIVIIEIIKILLYKYGLAMRAIVQNTCQRKFAWTNISWCRKLRGTVVYPNSQGHIFYTIARIKPVHIWFVIRNTSIRILANKIIHPPIERGGG